MSRPKEWLVLLDLRDTVFEAIDIYVERFLPDLLNNPVQNRSGNIELIYIDPDSDTENPKAEEKKFVLNMSYHYGYLSIKATRSDIVGSQRLPVPTDLTEFFFSGPLLEEGKLKVTQHDLQYNYPPVAGEMTLDELEKLMPKTFDLFTDVLLTLLIELAMKTFDQDLFDPFTAKVRGLISKTLGQDSENLWFIAKRFKESEKRAK